MTKESKFFYYRNPGLEPFNFKRKIWHLTGMTIPLLYYFDVFSSFGHFQNPSRDWIVLILFILAAFTYSLDILRFFSKSFRSVFFKIFGFIMKEQEKDRFNATGPMLLSNAIVFAFFPKEIAITTTIFQLFSDPIAAYLGGKYGNLRIYNDKSFFGLFSGLIGGIIIASLFFILHSSFSTEAGPDSIVYFTSGGIIWTTVFVAVLGALFGSVTEFITGNHLHGLIDDNFTIPIVSGFFMSLFLSIFRGQELFFYFTSFETLFQ
jgi:dolichol kinase